MSFKRSETLKKSRRLVAGAMLFSFLFQASAALACQMLDSSAQAKKPDCHQTQSAHSSHEESETAASQSPQKTECPICEKSLCDFSAIATFTLSLKDNEQYSQLALFSDFTAVSLSGSQFETIPKVPDESPPFRNFDWQSYYSVFVI